jgi:hypothetical protein
VAPSAAGSTTRYYLSTNSTNDAGDFPLDFRLVPALAAGATSPAESSETNNNLSKAMTITP